VGLLQSEDFEKLYPDMTIIAQTNAILDTPVELPALPQFIRPEPPMVMPLAQQQAYTREQAERLQAMATQFAQQQAYQNSLSIQNQANHPQQQQQLHPMQPPQMQQGQQRAPFDASNGHASPAVNSQGQGMLPPQNAQQNGRPPVIKRPSSQNGNPNGQGLPNVAIAQAQGQARPSGSPTYNLQGQPMNGSPQLGNGVMLPNGKPIIGANGQMDPTVQRMLVARAQLQAQQQQQQQHDASNATSSGNGNSNGHAGPVPTYDNMPPESQAQVRGMAIKGGFSDNPQAFQAFLNHRHNARLMQQTQAKQRADQAAIIAAQQAQSQPHGQGQQGTPRQPSSGSNGNTNGSATPASQEATFGTPQLPSGQLNLKLPPHATKRLGNNQTPSSPAQRAQ
jgi:enhancer of polycomb-like protein